MPTRSQHAEALADRLERDRERITRRWLERLRRRHVATEPLPAPELIDRLPEFLAHLSDVLRHGYPGGDDDLDLEAPSPTITAAREHGEQRYRHGFDIHAVVVEYTILLDVLFDDFSASDLHVGAQDWRVLVHAVSLGIAAAVDQFSAERDADVNSSHAALTQAREHERQLIGIVSHDLRNPLAIILACAEVVSRCQDLGSLAARALQRLRRNAERAVRLIGDLLDFTQERSLGRIPVAPTDADLQELVGAAVEEAAMTHPRRKIERRGESGPLPGRWDRDRIAQVLANLLDNALKFSPPDSVVTVETRVEGPRLVVGVHNWGPPIPPDRLASVFEAFQRATPTASARVSLGLGLHIARQIALAHGGSLDASSSAEHGTTFTIGLPRWCPPGDAPVAAAG